MNKPDLYNKFNLVPRAGATEVLKDYAGKMRWRTDSESAIDLGCGDGYVTSIIKKHVPTKDVKFVGSDINENMVEFAREHYSKENITFRVLDMGGDLPNDLKCSFNHVFSFYAIQLVKNQEKTFQNIYDLLKEGGDCLLCFVKTLPFNHMFIKSSEEDKWKSWIKDPKKYISPYHDVENAVQIIKKMMEDIGFADINVKCRNMKHVMQNGNEFKSLLKAVEPYKMPNDVFEEFAKDNVALAQKLGILDADSASFEEHDKPIDFHYQNLVVYATKP